MPNNKIHIKLFENMAAGQSKRLKMPVNNGWNSHINPLTKPPKAEGKNERKNKL